MRFPALWLILLAALNAAHADDAVFKVGVTTRDLVPAEPYDWRGASTHALRTTIWYPATAGAREDAQWIGPRLIPFVSAGRAARDAEPAAGRHPLILLSHGFGGTASDLAWLGVALAAHGFIAAAINHPGNNGDDGSTVEGAALSWLRAVDLSTVIDALRDDNTFGRRIDPARIGAAGHSFGGYTVIALAGGITDPERLRAFCRSPDADALCAPAPDVSALRQQSMARLASDADFRQRYGRAAASYRDARIRAVFALAPGPGPIFTPESLGRIAIPVALATGSADAVAPPASGAEALGKVIPQATLKRFADAGHFVFFGTCTAVGRMALRTVCRDPDGIDRNAVHTETIQLALDFFTASLR
ncbi:alpha/beta hydrolase family protein [Bradyrhizobium sp. 2TAF24]|uniref:alpha/beta hydrolase family protein n=1 Tax=Bradyrhizobium sp. 2TAF24 TaxID=3233011 RepID=UPI003F91A029